MSFYWPKVRINYIENKNRKEKKTKRQFPSDGPSLERETTPADIYVHRFPISFFFLRGKLLAHQVIFHFVTFNHKRLVLSPPD